MNASAVRPVAEIRFRIPRKGMGPAVWYYQRVVSSEIKVTISSIGHSDRKVTRAAVKGSELIAKSRDLPSDKTVTFSTAALSRNVPLFNKLMSHPPVLVMAALTRVLPMAESFTSKAGARFKSCLIAVELTRAASEIRANCDVNLMIAKF